MSITMSPDDLQNWLAAAMKQAMTGIATQVQPFNPQPHSVPSCAIFEQSFEKWATMLTKKRIFLSWVWYFRVAHEDAPPWIATGAVVRGPVFTATTEKLYSTYVDLLSLN